MKKKGFTLAEVLITLSILGVVAAISIPNMIQQYQRKVTVVKVKKFYSDLSSAYEQYLIENNNIVPTFDQHSAICAQQAYNTLIKPYFNVIYDAGTDSNKKKKIMGDVLYGLHNNVIDPDLAASSVTYAVKLKNGDVLRIWTVSNEVRIALLPNKKKEKTIIGIDYFNFYITNSGLKLYSPYNFKNEQEAFEKNCINGGGGSCILWIIAKGNMNYLDCPRNLDWDTGKCK